MKPWAVSRDETRQGYYKLSLVPNLSVIMAAKPVRSSFENFEGTTPHFPRFQVIEIEALSIRKKLAGNKGGKTGKLNFSPFLDRHTVLPGEFLYFILYHVVNFQFKCQPSKKTARLLCSKGCRSCRV